MKPTLSGWIFLLAIVAVVGAVVLAAAFLILTAWSMAG